MEAKKFYRIDKPLYEVPHLRFREFVTTHSDDPNFLLQIDPDKEKVSFIPSQGSTGGISIPISFFIKDLISPAELKKLSRFCSKFNMIASVASNPRSTNTFFNMKIKDGATKHYPDAKARLILNLKVTDPKLQTMMDSLLRAL